jgi:hypothetical protein
MWGDGSQASRAAVGKSSAIGGLPVFRVGTAPTRRDEEALASPAIGWSQISVEAGLGALRVQHDRKQTGLVVAPASRRRERRPIAALARRSDRGDSYRSADRGCCRNNAALLRSQWSRRRPQPTRPSRGCGAPRSSTWEPARSTLSRSCPAVRPPSQRHVRGPAQGVARGHSPRRVDATSEHHIRRRHLNRRSVANRSRRGRCERGCQRDRSG